MREWAEEVRESQFSGKVISGVRIGLQRAIMESPGYFFDVNMVSLGEVLGF
jgi:hypothetical protein